MDFALTLGKSKTISSVCRANKSCAPFKGFFHQLIQQTDLIYSRGWILPCSKIMLKMASRDFGKEAIGKKGGAGLRLDGIAEAQPSAECQPTAINLGKGRGGTSCPVCSATGSAPANSTTPRPLPGFHFNHIQQARAGGRTRSKGADSQAARQPCLAATSERMAGWCCSAAGQSPRVASLLFTATASQKTEPKRAQWTDLAVTGQGQKDGSNAAGSSPAASDTLPTPSAARGLGRWDAEGARNCSLSPKKMRKAFPDADKWSSPD